MRASTTRRAAYLAAGLMFSAAAARGQTWTGGASTSWSTAANWSSGVPVSAAGTALTFGAATNYTTIHNLANPFQLNQMSFTAGAVQAYNLSGNTLVIS